ncbi:Multidrug resistance protein NorM [Maioricimonas rarisocia]|uniref:Multidrug-efflux transporter n=1 Tax=Maioricimonas rarisocia TaxID=2528026 RepID=A0A517ZA68_9PLAN|nr:MATE family efflux transporter [Maioricimonas rarisocia]QDU39299.1 Multidrug resistance protein NorM [Maioricimonas rarisocia]
MDATATDAETTRQQKLLNGPLRQTVLLLALPVFAEQFLSFCVGFYDTFLAGHLSRDISTAATAAVGVAAYVGWLASMLFSMVGAGTTALVARARGAGDMAEANRVANRSVAMSIVGGVLFVAIIVPAAPLFASVLKLEGTAAEITIRYLRFDAIGMMFTSVGLVGAAALRGCGNMQMPFWIHGTINVLNVLVSTTLVYGLGPIPRMGVDGIVLGTVVARTSGGLIMIAVLARGVSGLKLMPREFHLRGETVRRILRVGIPAAADGAIMWSGHFLFLRIIGSLGEAAFAAHIIGIRIEAITYLPAVAWGAAAATLIGQSLGAHDIERARHAGREAVLQCGLLGVAITLIFLFGAEQIYTFMHNDPAVRAAGIPAFRMVACFQIPLIVAIVFVSGLRGAGDTRYPMLITAFSTFGLRLPLAYLGGVVLDGGLIGAWIGMCADMLARGVLVAARFLSGKWTKIRV